MENVKLWDYDFLFKTDDGVQEANMPALFSSTSDRAAYAFARLEVTAASTSKIDLRFFLIAGLLDFDVAIIGSLNRHIF